MKVAYSRNMSYKLTYFNGRGRAEFIRLIFAQAGVQYEDVRIERADWQQLKPKSPFGQLPMLETEGVTLCQSLAVARYLARKFDLAGKTDLEQARADMLVDCFEDTVKPMLKIMTEPDESKKAEIKKKFLEEELPKCLTALEKLLEDNKGGDGFFVGDALTWADISFLSLSDWLSIMGADSQIDNYPKLGALRQKVSKTPKIAEWLEKRPKTSF